MPDQVAESALVEVATDLGLDVDDLAALVVASAEQESEVEGSRAPGLSLVTDPSEHLQEARYTLGPPRHRRGSTGWTVSRLRRSDASPLAVEGPPRALPGNSDGARA